MQPSSGDQSFEKQFQSIQSEVSQKMRELTPEQTENGRVIEKAILHNVIGEKLGKPSPAGAHSPQAQTSDDSMRTGMEHVHEPPEFKRKVEQLINIVFQKNIDTAVEEVKKTYDAALIDAFHDTLVDELYERLVDEDKLKKLK